MRKYNVKYELMQLSVDSSKLMLIHSLNLKQLF